jgi:late competence protein required for DNA uptake (superfamily II DNA/RNA helicase)
MNITQEKIIQAMGRIGRNKIQQDYSVRFRDDEQIKKLFSTESDKPEVRNMNRLFVTSE